MTSETEKTTTMQDAELELEATSLSAPPQEETTASYSNGVSFSPVLDPLQREPSNVVREGDSVILVFGDGRQTFAHCVRSWKGKLPPVKINKRSYPTANLIGLPYGTVLELERSRLAPLPAGADLIPEYPHAAVAASQNNAGTGTGTANSDDNANSNEVPDGDTDADDTTFPAISVAVDVDIPSSEQARDNRHIVDNNKSQGLDLQEIYRLRDAGVQGSTIVHKVCF
jgi:hypothetical protein